MSRDEEGDLARLHAVVEGDVQGVGYRQFVRERARDLRIKGWVRNRDDGTVECVAEGTQPALRQLVDLLRSGPGMASVRHVEPRWEDAQGDFTDFQLRG